MTGEEFRKASGLDRIPPYWDARYVRNLDRLSKPVYRVKEERDVWVTLRDGVRISVDIFRPDVAGETVPCLIAWSAYGKSIQSIKHGSLPPGSLLFDHSLEAGDIDFYVRRGYAFVIPDPRGIGKSEGEFYGIYNPQEQRDVCDVIEWAGVQDWCTGKVALNGFSYFGIIQMLAAAQQPRHLVTIMPLSFTDDYYQHGYYGGVPNTYMSMYWELCPANNPVPWSTKMYSEEELKARIAERLKDPDIAPNSYFVKILTTWPPRYQTFYLDYLLHPLDGPFWRERSAGTMFDRVKVPVYLKCGWSPNGRWTNTVFHAMTDPRLAVYKRALVGEAYAGLELPYRFMNEESLRWYDHWLKGVDTGILDEPPLKVNVLFGGFRYEQEWPLARTEWKRLYLRSFGQLRWEADPEGNLPPDCFVHLPPNVTTDSQALVYRTDPFARPMEFTGPVALTLYASIDAPDANFITKLWMIQQSGERFPLCRWGALRASHPLDEARSTEQLPVHDHTKSIPVVPGEIRRYDIEINPIGTVFLPGTRIELEIRSTDAFPFQQHSWTGKVGAMGPLQQMRTVAYKIYRDADYPSHVLMPFVPATPKEQWLQPLG